MSGIEGLFAIFVVALMPVALVFLTRYYALREKELAARTEGDLHRLGDLVEEKRLLEARVENLESIVCQAEFEVHQRLLQLPAPRTIADARRALRSRAPRRWTVLRPRARVRVIERARNDEPPPLAARPTARLPVAG